MLTEIYFNEETLMSNYELIKLAVSNPKNEKKNSKVKNKIEKLSFTPNKIDVPKTLRSLV